MKKFRVFFKREDVNYRDIEAPSLKEVEDIANKITPKFTKKLVGGIEQIIGFEEIK